MGWSNITRCDSKFFGDRISGKKRNAVKSSHHQKQKVFARTCFCCTSFVVDAWYRIGERFHTHTKLCSSNRKKIYEWEMNWAQSNAEQEAEVANRNFKKWCLQKAVTLLAGPIWAKSLSLSNIFHINIHVGAAMGSYQADLPSTMSTRNPKSPNYMRMHNNKCLF